MTTLGRDDVLGLAPGYWIELTDETHELAGAARSDAADTNVAGNGAHVDAVTRARSTARISGQAEGPPLGRSGRPAHDRGPDRERRLPRARGRDRDPLRDRPHYATGDYWLIPARTANGDVDWPEDAAAPANRWRGRPKASPITTASSLSSVRAKRPGRSSRTARNLFPPLTDLRVLQAEPGVHVVHIRSGKHDPLRNDTDLLVQELARSGIELDCDQEVESNTLGARAPTLLLTLDLPFPLSPTDKQFWGENPIGTIPLTLDGIVRVDGKQILWHPTDAVAAGSSASSRKLMIGAKLDRLLLHLTLKGNFVYGTGYLQLDVDGEAFGVLHDGTLDVGLPTGDGRRGGTPILASAASDRHHGRQPRGARGPRGRQGADHGSQEEERPARNGADRRPDEAAGVPAGRLRGRQLGQPSTPWPRGG